MASAELLKESELEILKQKMIAAAVKPLLHYFTKDLKKNLHRMMAVAELVARQENHKVMLRSIRTRYLADPRFVKRAEEYSRNPAVMEKLLFNWGINGSLLGIARHRKLAKKLGINIPYFILIDPTSACNLKCTGCWAGKYSKHDTLPPELLDRIFTEAKQLGIYWIVLSGGEPFIYKHLFDLARKHDDLAFMAYTNGTLIDDEKADEIAKVGNISPCFSLEGWRERTDARRGEGVFDKVVAAMDRMRERGVPIGASVTVTRQNCEELFSDEFIDFLMDKGVLYMWSFHYIPIGRDPDLDLLITNEQRAWLSERVTELRYRKPLFIGDFWNDGEHTMGCIAGGRIYFHINAAGDVEPCAFAHFAVDNIKNKSLVEVLSSPIFKAYQKRQPFNQNHMLPCPIIDNPQALRDIVEESGARPTHDGAETVLTGDIARFLDQHSAEWSAMAPEVLERRHRISEYYRKVLADQARRELGLSYAKSKRSAAALVATSNEPAEDLREPRASVGR